MGRSQREVFVAVLVRCVVLVLVFVVVCGREREREILSQLTKS